MNRQNTEPARPIHYFQEEVEDLDMYRPGGYHPLNIKDKLSNGRYRIVHKLGSGSHSTVWLCQDRTNLRYVALKLATSETSYVSQEVKILEHLQATGAKSFQPGREYVPSLFDSFFVQGPNGQHQCLVSEPARCSLALSKCDSFTSLFPMESARTIAAQTILGVRFIHSCGVVHGDLHLGNILLTMPVSNNFTLTQLYQKYGEPRQGLVKRCDGKEILPGVPTYGVAPAWFGDECDNINIDNAQVQISDFGQAFLASDGSSGMSHVPLLLRPPEEAFEASSLRFPGYIWTLACTLYEILGNRSLFEGFLADRTDVIRENISTIGPLPSEWWEAWTEREEFFNSDGTWKQDTKRAYEPRSRPLSERVDCMGRGGEGGFSQGEQADVVDMLSKMLVFKPASRITAEDLVDCTWMKRWGLPSFAKVRARTAIS